MYALSLILGDVYLDIWFIESKKKVTIPGILTKYIGIFLRPL
jgi:hypothetical protein